MNLKMVSNQINRLENQRVAQVLNDAPMEHLHTYTTYDGLTGFMLVNWSK